jgi:drug/metabolite transporter (DMT)-like permease
VTFSLAYLRLSAGTGALVLFAATQLTMLATGIARGERPPALEWLGIALAVCGLIALTLPGLSAPDPVGAALMFAAGIGWGAYSLHGRGAADPAVSNARNFARVLPLTLLASAVSFRAVHGSVEGVLLATCSGAVTSGGGYVIWYAALRGLTRTRAAVVQLLVPALAAAGGVVLLHEVLTPRLLACGGVILAGVLLSQLTR